MRPDKLGLMKLKNTFAILFCCLISAPSAFAASTQVSQERSKPFFDFDVSGSSGNYNGSTYSEINLGLNLNFTDWLTWRNAGFKRFTSGGLNDSSGLDSSVRFTLDTHFDGGGLSFFAGPGYRWANPAKQNGIFGEGGASIHLGRFSLGAGAKYLRYDQAQYDSNGNELKRDDISYFITVAGGAGLSF